MQIVIPAAGRNPEPVPSWLASPVTRYITGTNLLMRRP